MTPFKTSFDRLWTSSRSLTAFGIAMVILTAITASLALIDSTQIDHQLRWIKPTKFGISFAVYAFSVAWIFGYVEKSRLKSAVGTILTATGMLEVAVITGQVVRGRTSHFNTETELDGALFALMGTGIVIFFIANLVAVLLAARARIADRVLATGLRLGFAVASVGMLEAALMLGPTPEQSAEIAGGKQPARVGAHTVGAEDGKSGLPLVGWSTEGGDLRPAHFFGMHALQILPFFAVLVRRRRRWTEEQKIRMVWTWSSVHLALTALLTWQALRGQPITAPDALTLGALATILFASSLASFLIVQQPMTARLPEVAR